MTLQGNSLTKIPKNLEYLKELLIGKISFDLKKELVIIEKEEDAQGDTEFLLIEPNPVYNSKCCISQFFRNKKGASFARKEKVIINIPFSKIMDSSLGVFLGYFTEMIDE